MDNREKLSKTTSESEINFIDIVAVLIKHRWLISIITLGTLLLSVFMFYLLPIWGISVTGDKSYTAEVDITMPALSIELQEDLNFPIGETSFSYARNPQIIAEVYRNYVSNIGSISEQELIATVRNDVIGKSLKIDYSEDNNILSISYTNSKPEIAEKILKEIVSVVQESVASEIRTRLTSIADDLNASVELTSRTLLKTFKTSALPDEFIDELNTSLSEKVSLLLEAHGKDAEIRRQLSSSNFPWRIKPRFSVYLSSVSRSRALQTIVFVFIAFFISIFISFVLEYIHRVKNDEREMKKIHEAWKRK